MRDYWELPSEDAIQRSGPEWLLMLMNQFSIMSNLPMVLWRAWHVRNCITQEGKWTPIESSVIFLTNYMTSLTSCNYSEKASVTREGEGADDRQ